MNTEKDGARAERLGSAVETLVASAHASSLRLSQAAACFDAVADWAEGGSREAAVRAFMVAQGALDLGGSDEERAALSRACSFFVSTRTMLEES